MRLNRIGIKYKRLLVTGLAFKKSGVYYWNCVCDCGNKIISNGSNLTSGSTKSCGCFKIDSVKLAKTKHGHKSGGKGSVEYNAWRSMKSRCESDRPREFKHYKFRGIKVCDRWINSFENFLKDMGPKPSILHSIDRINNDGNYEPSNCRWATLIEQANNRSSSRFVTLNGERMSQFSASKKLGFHPSLISRRMSNGITGDKLFEKPNPIFSRYKNEPYSHH